MLRTISLLGACILLVGVAGALAVPQAEQLQSVTALQPHAPSVGDFAVRYAAAMGLVGEKATPEQAIAALRASGVIGSDPLNPGARLTEADVVHISKKHLRVTTSAPGRAFSDTQLGEFFDVFGPEIRQIAQRDGAPSSIAGAPSPLATGSIGAAGSSGRGGEGNERGKGDRDERRGDNEGKGKGKGHSKHQP